MSKTNHTASAALALLVRDYDAAVSGERARWGDVSASHVAEKGVELDVEDRTMNDLIDRGLAVMTTAQGTGNELRRGAFGRWIGGSRTRTFVVRFYRPTDAGRAAIKQSWTRGPRAMRPPRSTAPSLPAPISTPHARPAQNSVRPAQASE
jgi:hypothetical protein